MLYRLKCEEKFNSICILKIDPSILKFQGVVITDRNAACDFVKFLQSPDGLKELDYDMIFAEYWNDKDPHIKEEKKQCIMAEVLIPDIVPINYIIGAYVSDKIAKDKLQNTSFNLPIEINSHIFFNNRTRND